MSRIAAAISEDIVANLLREIIDAAGPSDAGITTLMNALVTADGKTYGYSVSRELLDLFLVDGVR